MSSRVGRERGGRGVHLEYLEERALLSTAVVSHPPAHVAAISAAAATPTVVVLQGKVAGQAAPYTNPKQPAFNTSVSAKGAGPVVSLAGYQSSGQKGSTLLVANGKATFSFSRYTSLTVAYTGSGKAIASKPTQTLTFTGTITGGGGSYTGATGGFTATVVINSQTGQFTLSYVLKVTPKK